MRPILALASFIAHILPLSWRSAFYRIDPLARLIRTTLNRVAPPGLVEVTLAAGDLAGFRMQLDLKREKDYWLATYEPELQTAVHDHVQPGMVVYDVGANIGYVSLLLAHQVGEDGKVFAFEALPANVERLKTNIRLNRRQEQISVVAAAVIDRDAPTTFLVHDSTSMGKAAGSAGRAEVYRQGITVDGITLDRFVLDHHHPLPQLIKIDIEGGEVLALKGMCRLLQSARPQLFVELHGEQAARACWEMLTAAGYRLRRMAPGYTLVEDARQLGDKAYVIAQPMNER